MSERRANPSLAVSYDSIVLQSHSNYRKKSLIEKFNISNQSKKVDVDASNFIHGTLIIEISNRNLLFKPHENLICGFQSEMCYYQEKFQKRMTISFNNIKCILYVNKNNECIAVKSADTAIKSFQSFIIICYDFRVYSFNRLGIYYKADAVRYSQELNRAVFDNTLKDNTRIIWEKINPDLIFEIYYKTITSNLQIQLKFVKNMLVIMPWNFFKDNNFNKFQFGPQIVYYSDHNCSCLVIADKLENKKFKNMVTYCEVKESRIFYLNNDNSDNRNDVVFPTNKELIEAFEKLFRLCTPRNKAEFKPFDKKWFGKLSDCGWLSLVNRCLYLTKTIVKSMSSYHSLVFMVENNSPVWSWLFGSLIQIICQPFVRTFNGFLSMITKNWILSGAYNNTLGLRPQLFLLFIDCAYQLLRLEPFMFEFNEEMLICLYDLFILAPPGFMSSHDYDFLKFRWNRYFVEPVLECLENKFFDTDEADCCLNIPKLDPIDFGSFWFKMYARWIPYVQVENGSLSVRHYFMISSINVDLPVYSNYPFSLSYDKVTVDNDYNNDDTRSINTVISDD